MRVLQQIPFIVLLHDFCLSSRQRSHCSATASLQTSRTLEVFVLSLPLASLDSEYLEILPIKRLVQNPSSFLRGKEYLAFSMPLVP